MVSLRRILAPLLAVCAVLSASAAGAGETVRPIVVELYTSQGCSSCPPADALLGRLAQRPGVIALSLPITYWDMLGWKDTLATEANTRRQKAYAAAMGHGGVYTPQIIVDGVVDVVGSRAANVEAAIAQRRATVAVAVSLARAETAHLGLVVQRADGSGEPHTAMAMVPAMPVPPVPPLPGDPVVPVVVTQTPQEMHIEIGAVPGTRPATVWMVHVRSAVTVRVGAGENQDRTITYHNVVGDIRAIGVYKGRALSLTLPRSAMAGLPHDGVAVFVQQDGYGHIIGAAYISRADDYADQQ